MNNNKNQTPFCPYCGTQMENKDFMVGVGDEVEWDSEWNCPKCKDFTLNKKMRELAGLENSKKEAKIL